MIELNTPCITWGGYIDPDGYGRTGRAKLAHRVAYERHVGPIPPGLEIDHLCRNRACVNPAHLEPVTHAENMRRSMPFREKVTPAGGLVNAAKTSCVNGHEFDEANTYIRPTGHRDCRACIRCRVGRYKASKRSSNP